MGLPEFGRIDWLGSTGSTNADLIQRARETDHTITPAHDIAAGVLFTEHTPWLRGAHLQTAGKGRAGRPWQNVAGQCLMFSCAFEPQIPLAQLPGIAPALGVATCHALRSLLGHPPALQLKWPNDLQWEGSKLAGLLIETAPAVSALTETTRNQPMIVVGMGLNLTGGAELSAHLERPITDLNQIFQSSALRSANLQPTLTPATLVIHIARAWQQALIDYKNNGYAAFTHAFSQMDALAGAFVQVNDQGNILHEGLAQGTDEQGRLTILTEAGFVSILVGDISIRPGRAMKEKP